MERRLAAILAADVVGYSRLMGVDEEATLARLNAYRAVIDGLVADHRGRVFGSAGDSVIAEFASPVEAVRCALKIQQGLESRDGDLAEDHRMRFRIGVNLGDVVAENENLHGDGVNIAARLEELAEPGGVCVSGTVYDHLGGKLDIVLDDLGEQKLKNIARPVRVWRWAGEDTTPQSSDAHPPLPDKLSIAVLAFTNMSGDPEQEYFSDGITEDIITELSRFAVLHVVARHSSFAFKGEKLDIKEVGQRLGAQYVVEGSVRRAGNRVRVTAQLIEAESGTHIWAERYDREFEDIFAVQDEVTRSIVGVLPGRVQEAVADRASRKRPDNMNAYELVLRGKFIRDSFSAEDTARARPLFEKAIELDPGYAKAHAYLADTYFTDIFMGVATADAPQLSLHHARKAMDLDSNDVANHDQLGFAYIGAGMWEDAEAQFDEAVSKVSNEAEPMTWIGYGLLMLGRPKEARDMVLEAKRLDPLHPPSFDWVLGQACFFAKRHEDVIRVLIGRALLNAFAYACLAGAYGYLDRADDARGALDSFLSERRREFQNRNIVIESDTLEALAGSYRVMWRKEADWDHFADGLRHAGLPD